MSTAYIPNYQPTKEEIAYRERFEREWLDPNAEAPKKLSEKARAALEEARELYKQVNPSSQATFAEVKIKEIEQEERLVRREEISPEWAKERIDHRIEAMPVELRYTIGTQEANIRWRERVAREEAAASGQNASPSR